MVKIAFLGAGSTVFVRNVIGDCMCSDVLRNSVVALYDIDEKRLEESYRILCAMNQTINDNRLTIKTYCGEDNRREALCGADFVINAVQVGGYDPCTITDFEIPKRYGLRQTIGDTLGIGGIMRALRTIPVMRGFARDMAEVCPDALFLNYTNPMAILTGYMNRFTSIRTLGLCHSVQVCSERLLQSLGMEDRIEGRRELIAGINHMGWLLEIRDRDGLDLYPEIRKRAAEMNSGPVHKDMVRFDYIRNFGYYCTESSEHNAEYNNFYIKSRYPELIERYGIPLDEYPRRCVRHEEKWAEQVAQLMDSEKIVHTRSREYATAIMEAIITDTPITIGGNVMNSGLIDNLPEDACVEVPCIINGGGVNPCHVGRLPVQLAAMNMTNINVQLMTIHAAVTKKREDIYMAAMLDPHTSSELSVDDIRSMVDELIDAHGVYMKDYT